jgi:hypothetical protein
VTLNFGHPPGAKPKLGRNPDGAIPSRDRMYSVLKEETPCALDPNYPKEIAATTRAPFLYCFF